MWVFKLGIFLYFLNDAICNSIIRPHIKSPKRIKDISCSGDVNNICDSGLCYDSIDLANHRIASGCASTQMCSKTECKLFESRFVCCCAGTFCNGKSPSLLRSRLQIELEKNPKAPIFKALRLNRAALHSSDGKANTSAEASEDKLNSETKQEAITPKSNEQPSENGASDRKQDTVIQKDDPQIAPLSSAKIVAAGEELDLVKPDHAQLVKLDNIEKQSQIKEAQKIEEAPKIEEAQIANKEIKLPEVAAAATFNNNTQAKTEELSSNEKQDDDDSAKEIEEVSLDEKEKQLENVSISFNDAEQPIAFSAEASHPNSHELEAMSDLDVTSSAVDDPSHEPTVPALVVKHVPLAAINSTTPVPEIFTGPPTTSSDEKIDASSAEVNTASISFTEYTTTPKEEISTFIAESVPIAKKIPTTTAIMTTHTESSEVINASTNSAPKAAIVPDPTTQKIIFEATARKSEKGRLELGLGASADEDVSSEESDRLKKTEAKHLKEDDIPIRQIKPRRKSPLSRVESMRLTRIGALGAIIFALVLAAMIGGYIFFKKRKQMHRRRQNAINDRRNDTHLPLVDQTKLPSNRTTQVQNSE